MPTRRRRAGCRAPHSSRPRSRGTGNGPAPRHALRSRPGHGPTAPRRYAGPHQHAVRAVPEVPQDPEPHEAAQQLAPHHLQPRQLRELPVSRLDVHVAARTATNAQPPPHSRLSRPRPGPAAPVLPVPPHSLPPPGRAAAGPQQPSRRTPQRRQHGGSPMSQADGRATSLIGPLRLYQQRPLRLACFSLPSDGLPEWSVPPHHATAVPIRPIRLMPSGGWWRLAHGCGSRLYRAGISHRGYVGRSEGTFRALQRAFHPRRRRFVKGGEEKARSFPPPGDAVGAAHGVWSRSNGERTLRCGSARPLSRRPSAASCGASRLLGGLGRSQYGAARCAGRGNSAVQCGGERQGFCCAAESRLGCREFLAVTWPSTEMPCHGVHTSPR